MPHQQRRENRRAGIPHQFRSEFTSALHPNTGYFRHTLFYRYIFGLSRRNNRLLQNAGGILTGAVVQSLALADVGGARSNYYKDDATIDPADFGDKKSYADLGAYLAAPNANLHFTLWYDILPANQPRLGATYLGYATHPLQTQAGAQQYNGQAMPWLHLLLRGE